MDGERYSRVYRVLLRYGKWILLEVFGWRLFISL